MLHTVRATGDSAPCLQVTQNNSAPCLQLHRCKGRYRCEAGVCVVLKVSHHSSNMVVFTLTTTELQQLQHQTVINVFLSDLLQRIWVQTGNSSVMYDIINPNKVNHMLQSSNTVPNVLLKTSEAAEASSWEGKTSTYLNMCSLWHWVNPASVQKFNIGDKIFRRYSLCTRCLAVSVR